MRNYISSKSAVFPKQSWFKATIEENPFADEGWTPSKAQSTLFKNGNVIWETASSDLTFLRPDLKPEANEARRFFSIIHDPVAGNEERWKSEYNFKGFKTDNLVGLTGVILGQPAGKVDLYTHLPFIAGLLLNLDLPVTVEDSEDDEHIHEIIWRQEHFQSESGNEVENFEGHWESTITDVLGAYDSVEKHITIYVNLIEITAKLLSVDYQTLYEVVLAHEISHAITHLSYDENGSIWEWFDLATSESKELLAQLLPHILFRDCAMTVHAEVMEKGSGQVGQDV